MPQAKQCPGSWECAYFYSLISCKEMPTFTATRRHINDLLSNAEVDTISKMFRSLFDATRTALVEILASVTLDIARVLLRNVAIIKFIRAGGKFRLVVCDNESTNVLKASQLDKDYKQMCHNRRRWHDPIETVLKQLQLISQ